MSPRPALATTLVLSVLALAASGVLAADPPPPDKTVESAGAVPTTTFPTVSLAVPTTSSPAATTAGPTTTSGADSSIAEVIDIGDAKPQRFYDAYLAAAIADIQNWWAQEYSRLFGSPWEPLEGGIFAAYPERTDPIPGCGFPENTTYQEVSDFGAFYCPGGDYIAYDDGSLGVIYELAETFSPSVVAVVMAHEFGHAVQNRTGVLDRDVATIYTEQQADCFSGAWARRAWEGLVVGVLFSDGDIRTGLVALVAVADPIGSSVLEPGGHGAAFDRIGAFQEGFVGGIDNCVELIDKPLPLLPNEFLGSADELSDGDARFGWNPGEIMAILTDDLGVYWPAELGAQGTALPAITVRAVGDPATDHCGDPQTMANFGAVLCQATGEVLFDEVRARELYDDFGDFAVGYVVGTAWADAVQHALGSSLQGEARALASDCLVGAWVGAAIKGLDRGIAATTSVPAVARPMTISPGDLDEAVQTALDVGDSGLGDNLEGSAFEKIASIRRGVLNGLPSCIAEITGG